MASQSLYRKWRSQTFGDLVGQEEVIRTLQNAVSGDKLAHAYLFTGPRGTGKTSVARLLAKSINCTNSVNGEPCNQCSQCREITVGNSFNVIEIDAASNRGIDSIRDLREKVMMPPVTGKYKVYVLDEAHMLTTEAFNALLKTLEEPPPYAIFVMATTDVHKMLPTVLSRCQRFDFKRITTRQIVEHVGFVAKEEHVKLERAAAELIARTAAGGMRDALSLLDQAIAYAGEEISLAQVQTMLGIADPHAIQNFITHIAHLDNAAGLHLIHELSEGGADLRQVNTQVVEYWRALMLAKAGADVATILDRTEDETREIMQTAQLFGLEELIECARTCAQNELMQKSQGTPQLGLELAFLECVNLHHRAQTGQPLAAATSPTVQSRPAPVSAQPQPPPTQSVRSSPSIDRSPPPAVTKPVASPPPVAAQAKQEGESGDLLPDWEDLPSNEEDEHFEILPTLPTRPASKVPVEKQESVSPAIPSSAPAVENQHSLTLQQVKNGWENVKKRVKQKDVKTAAMLNDYTITGLEEISGQPMVVIQAAHDLHYRHVNEQERYLVVEWAFELEFGQKCRVRLLPPGQTSSRAAGSRVANTVAAPAPQPSAHRERPMSAGSSSATPPPQSEGTQDSRKQHQSAPLSPPSSSSPMSPSPEQVGQKASQRKKDEPSALASSSDVARSSPLARTNVVRENTSTIVSQGTIEQKVSNDPVVREVQRIFGAKVVQIQPK